MVPCWGAGGSELDWAASWCFLSPLIFTVDIDSIFICCDTHNCVSAINQRALVFSSVILSVVWLKKQKENSRTSLVFWLLKHWGCLQGFSDSYTWWSLIIRRALFGNTISSAGPSFNVWVIHSERLRRETPLDHRLIISPEISSIQFHFINRAINNKQNDLIGLKIFTVPHPLFLDLQFVWGKTLPKK